MDILRFLKDTFLLTYIGLALTIVLMAHERMKDD
jgi:hypothetical protein